ncbi:MAG TPA: exosortase E/protease, VPEID-CTERM system [Steroidobacteraceae bacterium]|jgi:exosortase E/protease (VPEID-CTERM system)
MNLALRIAVIALLLVLEKTGLNLLVDFHSAKASSGLGALVQQVHHSGIRFLVSFAIALGVFAYVQGRERLGMVNTDARAIPVRWSRLLLHVAALVPLVPLSYFLYGHESSPLPFAATLSLWLIFAGCAVGMVFTAMLPWTVWASVASALGILWLYAASAAAAATIAIDSVQRLWEPMAQATFAAVSIVLTPLIGTLHGDPTTRVLDTGRFAIQVADECSGLEGVGLMLTFCAAWLVLFRKEYIFPRALVLVPVGVVVILAFNVLRIAALVLIGHAGLPDVALLGFHSQAGWIAFNGAAGGIVFFSRRMAWLNRSAVAHAPVDQTENPTAAYLMPFLAILAAGMVAHAMSNGFELLYVLRPVACVAALLLGWRRLTTLDWRFSWRGVSVGVAIFVLWIGVARFLVPDSSMPAPLTELPPVLRAVWIAIRAAAAVVTVPIAEELAYRGFLMRRVVRADFERVDFRSIRVWPLLASSVVFGLAHGSMWLPGIVAGLAYGAVLVRTGRIGEAVAAHATTNALLAVTVVIGGEWQLW